MVRTKKVVPYFTLLTRESRITLAASFPPRPKAIPPASATIATNPVKRIRIRSCATPSWLSTANRTKIVIATLVTDDIARDASTDNPRVDARTKSAESRAKTSPTRPMIAATNTFGKYSKNVFSNTVI